MSVGPGGKLTVVSKAPIGALPEGVAFSPNSEYVYIGNYHRQELADLPHRGRKAGGGWNYGIARPTGFGAGSGEIKWADRGAVHLAPTASGQDFVRW